MKTEASTTFITEGEHVMNTFEKKYFEVFGNNHERRINLPGLSPELIAKRQELENIQQELSNAREDQEKWMVVFEQKKSELNEKRNKNDIEEKKNSEFHRHIQQEINKFNENKGKQTEMIHKFETEYSSLVQTESEIVKRLEYLKSIIEELQPSAKFFEQIVEKSQAFATAEEILHRYDTLINTKNTWSQTLQHLVSSSSPGEVSLKEELEKQKNLQVSLSNTVLSLKDEIERLKKGRKYSQINAFKNIERVTEKEEEYATVISSIDNICERVLSSQEKIGKIIGFPDKPKTIEQKLDIIEKRFFDLSAIVYPERLFEQKKAESSSKYMTRPATSTVTPRKKKQELENNPATSSRVYSPSVSSSFMNFN